MFIFLLMVASSGTENLSIPDIAGYNFDVAFGEISEDLSGNAYTLTSGSTLSTADSDDVIFTPRGAYFYYDSIMKFPPNSVSNSFLALGESFFISTWLHYQNPGPFFQVRTSEVYFELSINASSVSWTFFGDTYTVEHSSTSLEWIFIHFELRREEMGSTLKFISPASEEFKVSGVFEDKFYERMILGGGFEGIIYNFYLEIENSSASCFLEGSCRPAMGTCDGEIYVDEECMECPPACTDNFYSCYSAETEACIQCPDACMQQGNHGVCSTEKQEIDKDRCTDVENEYCSPFSYDFDTSSCDWTSCTDNCEVCSSEGTCIVCNPLFTRDEALSCVESCPEGFYAEGEYYKQCKPCPEECPDCSDNGSCDPCPDPLFEEVDGTCRCPDGYYQSGTRTVACLKCSEECSKCNDGSTCTECVEPRILNSNGSCDCPGGFFETSSQVCSACSEGCEICTDENSCTACKDTFVLESGRCKCPENHKKEKNACVEILEASLSYDGYTLLLTFSENLSPSLSNADIRTSYITPSNTEIQVDVTSKNLAEYEIEIQSGTEIPDDTDGLIIEIGPIMGESGASMSNSVVIFVTTKAVLESVVQADEDLSGLEEMIEEASGPTAATTMTSGSILLCISMSQFSALWSFINAAQMFALMPIQSMETPEAIASMWLSFDEESLAIPNLGKLIYEDDHTEAPAKWKENKYESTAFLINTGEFIFIALFSLIMFPVFYLGWLLFRRWRKLGKFMMKRMKDYKWCFFLRLVIQGFIDLMASALLSAGTILEEVSIEAVLSITILVIGFLFTGGLFLFVYVLQNKIQERDKKLTKLYGTIFDEFRNDKGYFSMIYYPLFCVRRLIYIFVLYFGRDYPLIQILTNLTCTLCVVAYLIYYKPFKEIRVQEITLVSECVIAFNFGLSLFCIYDLNEDEKFIVVTFIFLSFFVMLGIIYYNMILSHIELFKRCLNERRKKKIVLPEIISHERDTNPKEIINVNSDSIFNVVHNTSS